MSVPVNVFLFHSLRKASFTGEEGGGGKGKENKTKKRKRNTWQGNQKITWLHKSIEQQR